MKTYVDYLNTLTIKALKEIAKQAGLKGYSAAKKDALVTMVDNEAAAVHSDAQQAKDEFTNALEILNEAFPPSNEEIEAEMNAEDTYEFDGAVYYGDIATMLRVHDKAVRRFNPTMRRDKAGMVVLTPRQRRRVHKHDRKASKSLLNA